MANALEARLVISAEDKTGAVVDAVARKIDGLGKSIKNVESTARALGGVTRHITATERALAPVTKTAKTVAATSAAVAGSAAGIMAAKVARDSVTTYKHFDDLVRYQRAVMGISKEDQKPLIDQALKMGATTPFNDLQVLEAQLDLAQRGVKKDLIIPIVQSASEYAQAMNAELPEAAKTIEGILFSTRKHMEDGNEALANAKKTVDFAAKLAKVGGLDNEDVKAFYKYGGAPGATAGLPDAYVGAMAALMRRSNVRGDEAGVAVRAFSGRLVAPTRQALDAYRTMGIDFNKFTSGPGQLSAENLGLSIKAKFGKGLTANQLKSLGEIMGDTEVTGSRENFVEKASDIVAQSFDRKKDGSLKAADAKAIAKAVDTFYKLSVASVNTPELLRAIIAANPTLNQANAIFGEKQGGRFTAVSGGGVKLFDETVSKLTNVSEGFAKSIGDERMGGFSGALLRAEGAIKNFETALGRANDGWLTQSLNTFSGFVNSASKMSDAQLQAATAVGGFVAAVGLAEGAMRTLALMGMVRPGGIGLPALTRLGWAGLAATVGTGVYQAGSWLSAQPGFTVDPEQIKSGMKSAPLDFADFERARRAQDEFRRDPEGARGRAFQKVTSGPIEAQIKGDVVAKVEGHATVSSTVTVNASPDFITRVVQQVQASGVLQPAAGNEVGSTGKSQPDTGDGR